METPRLEAEQAVKPFGLWIEPWEQKPRLVSFADLHFPDDRRLIVVGKSHGCDLFVAGDEHISGEHWRLEERRGELWACDLDSTNGTWVNSVPLIRPVRLHDGFKIRFGRSFATIVGPDCELVIEGATYTSWMCNAAARHGSLRAAEERIHHARSTIHSALKRRAAKKARRRERKG